MIECTLCGWKLSMHDFRTHVVEIHKIKWIKEIPVHRSDLVPYNGSGRSFAQIISEAHDTWLAPFLVS